MIISEDRQSHFAHILTDGIWNDDMVDYSDEDFSSSVGEKAIAEFVAEEMDIDTKARAKVASLKGKCCRRKFRNGDILYKNITKKRGIVVAKPKTKVKSKVGMQKQSQKDKSSKNKVKSNKKLSKQQKITQ